MVPRMLEMDFYINCVKIQLQKIHSKMCKYNKQINSPSIDYFCLKECVFDNLALKIQCQIVKNTLLRTAFSAILPTDVQ